MADLAKENKLLTNNKPSNNDDKHTTKKYINFMEDELDGQDLVLVIKEGNQDIET